MSFRVKDLRTNQKIILTSNQLKENIINVTKSRYIHQRVLPERTGLRPTSLDTVINSLNEYMIDIKNVFIVSAVYKVNKNPMSRYLILVDGFASSEQEVILKEIIKSYVPIWSIQSTKGVSERYAEHSYLSEWFRKTMGNGFSFVDVDYMFYNKKTGHVLLLEEKNNTSFSVGYGQLLSYNELLRDVIRVNASMLFLFVHSNQCNYFICEKNDFEKENWNNNFMNRYPHGRGFYIKRNKIKTLIHVNELVTLINGNSI